MAYLLRLTLFFFAAFIACTSYASVPTQEKWVTWRGNTQYFGTSGQGSCDAAVASFQAELGPGRTASGTYSGDWCTVTTSVGDTWYWSTGSFGSQCPANSTLTGSSCVCSEGFVEQGTQCVPKKDSVCGPLQGMATGTSSMESDFGPQSTQWAASNIGKNGSACLAGCKVSGTMSACVSGTGKSGSMVCMLSQPSFTGDPCSETSSGSGSEGEENGSDKPKDCPVGYEKSAYAAGVCIPKPNDCPAGSSPSKYAEGVCIPDEKKDDGTCEDPKDPTKRVACEGQSNQCPTGYAQSTTAVGTCVPTKDGSGKDSQGNPVTCTGGTCTTTKPDGSKESKEQGAFCKENPDMAVCKESKGSFSGSCSASFRCDGDALQCSALQEQHKRNCQLFDTPNDASRLFDLEAKRPQENVLSSNGREIDLKGHINVNSVIGNGACPADVEVVVFERAVLFKLSEFCKYFNAMGLMVMLGTAVSCLKILGS